MTPATKLPATVPATITVSGVWNGMREIVARSTGHSIRCRRVATMLTAILNGLKDGVANPINEPQRK